MREETPNILQGVKPIYVKMKLGKRLIACVLTRVYYQDTPRERRIWVDVEVIDIFHTQRQKKFLRIAMENLHVSNYAMVVALSFRQEEADIVYRQQVKYVYACHVDFRLMQEWTMMDGYYWQGVMSICQSPSLGAIYVRGKNVPISRFTHVCFTPLVPYTLCVKDRNRIKVETSVIIRLGNNSVPVVSINGDCMYVTVHIGGKLYSGRNNTTLHSDVLKRIEYASTTKTGSKAGNT